MPMYSLRPVEGGISISVWLPKLTTMDMIDLDVTETMFTLEVAGVYHLVVKPTHLLNNEVFAKWNKEDRTLEVICRLAV